MSRSYWIKHPAFGVAVFYIAVLALGIFVGTRDLTPNDQLAAENAERVQTVPENNDETDDDGNPSTIAHHIWGDSPAQWVMALTAVLATLLIWRTLVVSRQMLKEAELATLAARETVDVTREIGQKQVRAYLEIEMVTINEPDDIRGAAVELAVTLKNSGQSRASDVTASYCFKALSSGDKIEGRRHFPSIGAGGLREVKILITTEDLRKPNSLDGTKTWTSFLYITASYADVFSTKDYADFAGVLFYSWNNQDFNFVLHPFTETIADSIDKAISRHQRILAEAEQKLSEMVDQNDPRAIDNVDDK